MSSSASTSPFVALQDGVEIPQLGFGVFQVPPAETAEAVGRALDAGYRHIDTATIYGNETGVGEALSASAVSREDVFITTKCWNGDQGHDKAIAACENSLRLLGIDQVDLYLIHWPVPSADLYLETWEAFIELHERGLARSIGVSNFQADHLDRIIKATGVTPTVNQIELSPQLTQRPLRELHSKLGIATEAWSPLAQGAVLDDPVIVEIAESHDKTPAQVVIRWHLDIGNIVIPKSVTPSRIAENLDVFNFTLTPEQIEQIETLDAGKRTGPDPDKV